MPLSDEQRGLFEERGCTPFEYSPLLHVQSETLCRHARAGFLGRNVLRAYGID